LFGKICAVDKMWSWLSRQYKSSVLVLVGSGLLLYYTSNKGLLEQCDKEENVAGTWAATYFLFVKKTVKRSAQCHVLARSLPGRRHNDILYIQWTLYTVPICVKAFHCSAVW